MKTALFKSSAVKMRATVQKYRYDIMGPTPSQISDLYKYSQKSKKRIKALQEYINLAFINAF